VRARTLDELQTLLDAPWTDEEVARFNRKRDEQREANRSKTRQRHVHDAKRGLREHGRNQRPGKHERSRRSDSNERESYIGVPLPGDERPRGESGGSRRGGPSRPGRGPGRGGPGGGGGRGGHGGGRGGGRGRSR